MSLDKITMTQYYSPIVFSLFTATIYSVIAISYPYVNSAITGISICFALLTLIYRHYIYGAKALFICIFTGCVGLLSIINLLHLEVIDDVTTICLISGFLVTFAVYCVSAFDAIMDDYMFESLVSKIWCVPKHSCYEAGVRIMGSSVCELGEQIVWNERYCYIQEEYNGKMNTVDNWVNDVDPDITHVVGSNTIHIWVLDKVNKYW